MLFPIIRVYDNDYKEQHIVGRNAHDQLIIEDGSLVYYNLQNGEGSKYGTYSFLGKEDEGMLHVEFMTFEELMKIYNKELKKQGD